MQCVRSTGSVSPVRPGSRNCLNVALRRDDTEIRAPGSEHLNSAHPGEVRSAIADRSELIPRNLRDPSRLWPLSQSEWRLILPNLIL